jgi:CubicO group peptidase (beta-lactamase class C family)
MTVPIDGFCEPRFAPMEAAFHAGFDEGQEFGASLAITHRGRLVADLWGGWADLAETRPWERDTIVPVASTTKIASTLASLMLVDRHGLDLDAPIARWWPEFAAGGKEAVTVRDAFTHQTGAPGPDPPVPMDVLRDWDAATAVLAATPHWFAGRRQVIYHSFVYGVPLGEIGRRLDGRLPSTFFRDEVAQKAGIDFQMALSSESDLGRLAERRFPAGPPPPAENALLARLFASAPPDGQMGSWRHLSACIPAASGVGNGRSIARIGAIFAMRGELDGVRYLSRSLAEDVPREHAYGQCPYLGWVRWGLGLALDCKEYPMASRTCFAWGGYGGSWGLMDQVTGVSVGYAPSNWSLGFSDLVGGLIDPRVYRLGRALEGVLADLEREGG